jgi:hypothetical protein
LTCQPSNTGLYASVGPAHLSCEIVAGVYNACFSKDDCYPGTQCDLEAGDPNEFTCIDSSAGTHAYDCNSYEYKDFLDCPGQNPPTAPKTPGTCGSPTDEYPSSRNKCIAIGGHSCKNDSDCPEADGSGQQMICEADRCVWPPWCGGPLNPEWNKIVTTKAENFAAIYKEICPTTYPYQYDDPTASFGCQQSAAGFTSSSDNTAMVASLGYTITFCPGTPK